MPLSNPLDTNQLIALLKAYPRRSVFSPGYYHLKQSSDFSLEYPLVITTENKSAEPEKNARAESRENEAESKEIKPQKRTLWIGDSKPLGEGSYGKVYSTVKVAQLSPENELTFQDKKSDEETVIKIIEFYAGDPDEPGYGRWSANNERNYGRVYPDTVVAVREDFNSIAIVSTKRKGMTLEKLREKIDQGTELLNFFQLCCIAFNLVQEYFYLVRGNVLHNDLSNGNVMVDPLTGDVSLIDLGLATERFNAKEPPRLALTSYNFGAPEIHEVWRRNDEQRLFIPVHPPMEVNQSESEFYAQFSDYGTATDVASLGKLLAYLSLNKSSADNKANNWNIENCWVDGKFKGLLPLMRLTFAPKDFSNIVPEQIRDIWDNFLHGLCCDDPADRISFYQAHLFLSNLIVTQMKKKGAVVDEERSPDSVYRYDDTSYTYQEITPEMLEKLRFLSFQPNQRVDIEMTTALARFQGKPKVQMLLISCLLAPPIFVICQDNPEMIGQLANFFSEQLLEALANVTDVTAICETAVSYIQTISSESTVTPRRFFEQLQEKLSLVIVKNNDVEPVQIEAGIPVAEQKDDAFHTQDSVAHYGFSVAMQRVLLCFDEEIRRLGTGRNAKAAVTALKTSKENVLTHVFSELNFASGAINDAAQSLKHFQTELIQSLRAEAQNHGTWGASRHKVARALRTILGLIPYLLTLGRNQSVRHTFFGTTREKHLLSVANAIEQKIDEKQSPTVAATAA